MNQAIKWECPQCGVYDFVRLTNADQSVRAWLKALGEEIRGEHRKRNDRCDAQYVLTVVVPVDIVTREH